MSLDEASKKSLGDAIEKLRKAQKLLKPHTWPLRANRDAEAGQLVDQVLADPNLPAASKTIIQPIRDLIARIETARDDASAKPIRLNALAKLTTVISLLETQLLLGAPHP